MIHMRGDGMDKDTFLDIELEKLKRTGSIFTKEELLNLRKKVKDKMNSTHIETSIQDGIDSIIKETEAFLRTGAVIGVSTCISLPHLYLTILGGGSIHKKCITTKTKFDIASITKLYTTLLTLYLKQENLLDFRSSIRDVYPECSHLYPYTIWDILCMSGEIRTEKRITEGKNKEEAEQILHTLYLHNPDKQVYTYTDMGLIILSKAIEKIIQKKLASSSRYADIMKFFLLEPMHLYQTSFFPTEEIAGNGRQDRYVNDPKSRILGGDVGSAGLFTTSLDLKKLAQNLFSENCILNSSYLRLLYANPKNHNKGIGGLYQKHPDLSRTYVPKEYSTSTFASEGTTGSVAIFDMQNQIHNNILVDSILEETGKKPENFKYEYNEYQKKITDITLELYLLQNYYKEDYSYVLKLS